MTLREKIGLADEVNREAMRQRFSACTGACEQGKKPCTTPDACEISLDDVTASAWFWAVLAIGLVGAGFLFAMLANWIARGMA
jgi:hypothetical protein